MVPDLIWSLANKSLLNVDATAGSTRYRCPETVRTFARRHDPDRDIAIAAHRLATWYLDRLGPGCALDRVWMARMSEEVDNLRGLLSLVASSETSIAQQLAWSIGQYHDLHQSYDPGIEEVARLVAELGAPTPSPSACSPSSPTSGSVSATSTKPRARSPRRGRCSRKSALRRGTRSPSNAPRVSSC